MHSGDSDDYVYDEATGEWVAPGDLTIAPSEDEAVEVRDSAGTLLADGDQVTLIKDLDVKGGGFTAKRGTLVKGIRLTADPDLIECNTKQVKGLVLRTEFLKKA